MMGTIESANNNIILKFECLINITNKFVNMKIDIKERYINELYELYDEYKLGVIKTLSKYFLLENDYKRLTENNISKRKFIESKRNYLHEYYLFINRENILNRMNRLFNIFKNIIQNLMDDITFDKKKSNGENKSCVKKKTIKFINTLNNKFMVNKIKSRSKKSKTGEVSPTIDNIKIKKSGGGKKKDIAMPKEYIEFTHEINKYNDYTITDKISYINYDECILCKKIMTILPVSSEMVCQECGITKILTGTVFEDEQFYYQEGQRTKHGTYDPSKHCKSWIDRILARESKTIPQNVIDDIKKHIIQNGVKNVDDITCNMIRKYLRITKHTNYNEHIPLIRKILTGISPPQLMDNEIQLIIIFFNKAIKIYEEIKPPEKTNVMYHPYIIYKIIEHIYSDPKQYLLRNEILSYIHLQSRETLIENDIIWKGVCEKLNIVYLPTDKNRDLV